VYRVFDLSDLHVHGRQARPADGQYFHGADPTEEFRLKDLAKIITNRGFLIIAALCVLFYSGVFPFLKYP